MLICDNLDYLPCNSIIEWNHRSSGLVFFHIRLMSPGLTDEEVASADGTPKTDVTIAACGVLE